VDPGLDGDQELTAAPTLPESRPAGRDSGAARLSSYLHRSPRVRLAALLAAPTVWLVVAYLGSLAVMFAAAFWSTESFTGALVKQFSWDNFQTLVQEPVYRRIALRTLGVAVAVTVVDAVIALPMAFYMAKVAGRRARRLLVAAILTPLWASYLVKAYAWRVMLGSDGPVNWALGPFHLSGPGYGLAAVTLTLAYLWLPYMILPVYAGLERLPDSLLEASSDLGAPAGRTFRSVVLPLVFPSLVAGSIFTFSLSLGDYISVKIVGGRTQLFGNVIYDNIGVAANLPFAAAAATLPVAAILLYLTLVRRTGALENL
jgi:putative spermidine/putrescine transport system permease protein